MLEKMAKLADDIVLTEQEVCKLYEAYQKRLDSAPKKRSGFVRKYCPAVVAAAVILFFASCFFQPSELVVYAAHRGEMIQLKLDEKVYLEKEETPLGDGYAFEISVEEGSYYYSIENEENLDADNIFRNRNQIFWIPDGIYTEDFRDQDGNIIKIPETDNSILNIAVYDSDGKEIEKVSLLLERKGERCSAEMLKYERQRF